jgi:prephenate dehydrogenase
MSLSNQRVAIAGLGLMGGSLAAALHLHCASLTGFDIDPEARAEARGTGWFTSVTRDLFAALRDTDLLLLAVPVRAILGILGRIGADLPMPAVVMDLGSTKAQTVAAMNALPPEMDAIGGHPMCGKEVSGISAADPNLYHGCNFVLCPLERTRPETLQTAHELVSLLQARPLIIDPHQHDLLVALTSHLPYLLASTLVRTAASESAGGPVWDLAASGFRDTSRVAAGSLPMMIDILLTNRAPILKALSASKSALQDLARAVESGDEAQLAALLDPPRRIRTALFTGDHTVEEDL